MSPSLESAMVPAQRAGAWGGTAVTAVVDEIRGSSWRNGAGGEGGGHGGLAAGVPEQIRAFRHLARCVEWPGRYVFSHVLGESPEEEAEEYVAGGFAFRKQGQHVVHQYGRPPVAEGLGIQKPVDQGPAGRGIAGQQTKLELVVWPRRGVFDVIDEVPHGDDDVRRQRLQHHVVLHVVVSNVEAAERRLGLLEPKDGLGRPKLRQLEGAHIWDSAGRGGGGSRQWR